MEITNKEHLLTCAEAEKFVKASPAGVKFALQISFDVPVANSNNSVYPNGGAGYVNISRKDAVRIVRGMFSETLEARGGRVKILVATMVTSHTPKPDVTYWIG